MTRTEEQKCLRSLKTIEKEFAFLKSILGDPEPKRRRRTFTAHLEETYSIHSWRKPEELKKKKK